MVAVDMPEESTEAVIVDIEGVAVEHKHKALTHLYLLTPPPYIITTNVMTNIAQGII